MESAPKSIVNDRFTVVSSGRQDFCVYHEEFPVSEPIVNQGAFLQATGEAKYTQDIGRQAPHLNGVYILNMGKNAQPYAQFQINTPSDLKEQFPEVVRVFTAEDLKEPTSKPEDDVYPRNNLGRGQRGFPGDTLFAQKKVSHILGDKVLGQCLYFCNHGICSRFGALFQLNEQYNNGLSTMEHNGFLYPAYILNIAAYIIAINSQSYHSVYHFLAHTPCCCVYNMFCWKRG